MLERRGHLLLIASAAAVLPTAGLGAYSASKAGVEALGRSLRVELEPHGVSVGVGYYLFLNTPMVTAGESSRRVPGVEVADALAGGEDVAAGARGRAHRRGDREALAGGRPPAVPARDHGAARPARHAAARPRDGRRDAAHGGGVRRRGRADRRRRRGSWRGERRRERAPPLIGNVVAGHRIVRLVGRGGMGVVYEAVEESLGRTVALKLVAPERAGEPGFRERFIAESRLAASIDHPNVLPVFKAGEEDGVLYLAMRFVDGADLRSLVRAARPDARGAHRRAGRRRARRRARAPARPPRRQARQRPDRPGDHAYLTDFGLVKALDESAGQTAHRHAGRHARLRRARTHPRRGRRARRATVLARLRALLHAHRPRAVPARGRRAQALGAPLRAAAAGPGLALRRRDRPRAGQGAAGALRDGAALGVAAIAAAGGSQPSPLLEPPAAASAGSAPPRPELAGDAAELLAAFEHAAKRAALLREALADTPPERIERRLAEVRGGQDPGKAKLVAALARHLAVQRKMQAALAAFDADTERILLRDAHGGARDRASQPSSSGNGKTHTRLC